MHLVISSAYANYSFVNSRAFLIIVTLNHVYDTTLYIKNSRTNSLDISSQEYFRKVKPFQCLIHLAAKTFVPQSYANSFEFYNTNIMGTINCLEQCKNFNAKMIFISSYVYGIPEYLPIDEKHPTKMWNPYATSKIIAENLCRMYSQNFGLDIIILRVFNMYGPNQNQNFVIPKIIKGVQSKNLVFDNSDTKRDFIYVNDVVSAIIKCISLQKQGLDIFNVGCGKSYRLTDVVKTISNITNVIVEPVFLNNTRKSEIQNTVANINKIKNELGWEPKYDIESGLIDYLREQ